MADRKKRNKKKEEEEEEFLHLLLLLVLAEQILFFIYFFRLITQSIFFCNILFLVGFCLDYSLPPQKKVLETRFCLSFILFIFIFKDKEKK